MPINKDLNVDPYFDDFDLTNQFYRVLFKPAYAVQARELTQMQTMMQNQIEQFGDNIFKEGSIIKGCNFTELGDLNYVKVTDKEGFDVSTYVGFSDTVTIGSEDYVRDNTYELRGQVTGVTASIIAATRGFETRNPDLSTFYINYTTTSAGNKLFQSGELLNIYKISTVSVGTSVNRSEELVDTINVTTFSGSVGNSFGLRTSPGIIFQKGHFLYSEEQLVIISKYTNIPDNVSVGFLVEEKIINAFQDESLYDNANGSNNQNAPGADRLKLIPILTALATTEADLDTAFFTLTRYSNGNAVTLRDVSQYNVLGEEMARRTYEESGDYIVRDFNSKVIRRDGNLKISVGSGLAYVKGFRVENSAEYILDIDEIANTSFDEITNQATSFNYGGYLNLANSNTAGIVSIDDFSTVQLQNSVSSNIGTARVRSVTNDKIFIFDIRLTGSNLLGNVEKIVGTSGFLSIDPNSVINKSDSAAMIFDTGMTSLKSTSNISLPVRTSRDLTGISSNTVIISPAAGEDFNLENNDILFVDSTNLNIDVIDASLSGDDLVVTLSETPSSSATIYFNKRIIDATPFTKASIDLFVKCDVTSTDFTSSAKYNLGFPDAYKINSITDSADNDVTSSFRLRTNQKNNYYDHSYIEYIQGRTVPADGLITVSITAFKLNDTAGEYFFTVDSYPDGVPKNAIKSFASGGKTYELRDSLDFRPYAEPISGANYTNASLLATAPTVSDLSTGVNVAPTFTASYEILTPALNQVAQIDYEFYLNRTDIITVDSYGKISLVKGNEVIRSLPPTVPDNQIKIADIYVPGIPALTPGESNDQNRNQYAVKITPKGVKSYKMKDIQDLEKKIDNIGYYVLLSALETETKNLNVVDENGLDRFKNGIIVDPFNDLNIANVDDAEFNAAIDFTEKSLMPAVQALPLNLKYKSSASASLFPTTDNAKIATLQRNQDISIISQPYATEFRNCVSNFYSYSGIGELSPEYDALYDTVTNPVNISVDLTSPLSQFTDAIQEFIPLTSTSSALLASSSNFIGSDTIVSNTFRDTTTSLQVSGSQVNESPVGDFVTNLSFNPYMRSRDVNIYMSGLRPNTTHYFFFDGVDVNSSIIPGNIVDNADQILRNGFPGDAVTSDAQGVIRAVFLLPESTFFVGDRKLEVADVDAYASISSGSTSYGFLMYRAYNFSIEKSALTVSTRAPASFISQTSTDRTVTRRIAPVRQADGDPLAQTFFIKGGMGLGSDTVFASKIDLYFKRKSALNGVTIQLREVVNGYPSYNVLPFGEKHLIPAEVNTSDDASVATTISFKAPVRLAVEKEYAVVIKPDAADPDYLVFTSKVGGVNLTPGSNQGLPVVQDWGDGVLFTSTNNRAWTSYQDEDVKFSLYRHNFNASSGSVTLTNDDHEFISTTNNIGRFRVGETVYKIETLDGSTANTVSVISGNNQISGTNLSATYAAGDFILVDDGATNKQIFKVESANSSVIVADTPASFTDAADGNPITLGTLVHYDFRYPGSIILENSSAVSTRKFTSADVIYGFDSGTSATISSIDNAEFSYIQPMIMRTNDSVTRSALSGEFVDPSNPTNTYSKDMLFNDKTNFSNNGMVVYSKSNDITREKTLDFTINMTNNSNVSSTPFVDVETASILAYKWKVTNNSATTSKYISKTIELTESLDAEDFNAYVTGYRPIGTNIKVYIKPQSANDPTVFETADWLELELTSGINLYSSNSNYNDYKEYVYKVADANKNTGILTYSNEAGTFEGYRKFAIKIEMLSENIFKAPKLLDYRGIALT